MASVPNFHLWHVDEEKVRDGTSKWSLTVNLPRFCFQSKSNALNSRKGVLRLGNEHLGEVLAGPVQLGSCTVWPVATPRHRTRTLSHVPFNSLVNTSVNNWSCPYKAIEPNMSTPQLSAVDVAFISVFCHLLLLTRRWLDWKNASCHDDIVVPFKCAQLIILIFPTDLEGSIWC